MALLEQTPVMSAAALNSNDLLGPLDYVEESVSGSRIVDDHLYQMPTTDQAGFADVYPAQDFPEPNDAKLVQTEAPSVDKVTDGAALDVKDVANQQSRRERISFEGLTRIPPSSLP